MANNNGFSVLDMADEYAQAQEIDPAEIFRQHPVSGKVKAELEGTETPADTPVEAEAPTKEKKAWVPDASLTEGMDEFKAPGAVYEKDEIKFEEEALKNNADEDAKTVANESMDDLTRKHVNIEEAKARHGIKYLHIPPGEMQVKMLIAAGDTNHENAQATLDVVLAEIKETYPEMIEYIQPTAADTAPARSRSDLSGSTESAEYPVTEEFGTSDVPEASTDEAAPTLADNETVESGAKIIIDKRNVPEISWTPEEIDKIKKSRTIELNIVEGKDVEFGSVVDVTTQNVDLVLSQYQRKTNDTVAALPASKYRATFTGLTFPEVVDLHSSLRMNGLDAMQKTWSICYDHIKNQSIGPWEEYLLYTDPNTGKTIKTNINADIPDDVDDDEVHRVTKYEDFLRKTSYLDLNFILWKIVCATAMDKEVVSINCHAKVDGGRECGNNYDWIYSPTDLLDMSKIDPAVLEEIKATGEAASHEAIMENYKTSPVCSNNYVNLPTSGFMAIYGHVSAYEYLEGVYGKLEELGNSDADDPTVRSRAMKCVAIPCIKAFLIPTEDGKYMRITGVNNIIKVLDTLNEIDWQVIYELSTMMIEPYDFKYSMGDVVCPRCKNRSPITIENMADLLFIVAQSLSSVNVTLRKTSNS